MPGPPAADQTRDTRDRRPTALLVASAQATRIVRHLNEVAAPYATSSAVRVLVKPAAHVWEIPPLLRRRDADLGCSTGTATAARLRGSAGSPLDPARLRDQHGRSITAPVFVL
jgi:hypothetical protein